MDKSTTMIVILAVWFALDVLVAWALPGLLFAINPRQEGDDDAD